MATEIGVKACPSIRRQSLETNAGPDSHAANLKARDFPVLVSS